MARSILLNGVSSAGKTTLAKAIQNAADDIYLHVSMDTFIEMLPDGKETRAEWFPVELVNRAGRTLPRITTGPSGSNLLQAMRQFAAIMASQGYPVIVDDVCGVEEIADYRRRFEDRKVAVVKVTAPQTVIAKREKARGDRLIGLAREQSEYLHEGIEYDLVIDTKHATPEENANTILHSLRNAG